MRGVRRNGVVAVAASMVLAVTTFGGAGQAAPTGPAELPAAMMAGGDTDNLPNPLAEEMSERRTTALTRELGNAAAGKQTADGPVAEVAKGQFVELEREGEDAIWTVLGEFGEAESPFGILQGGAPGPEHNQIPEPDRSVDNTTIWEPDFSEPYYEDLLFSEAPGAVSMRNYYIEQSSGRYAVNGDVTDWAQVPYRTAHYGRDYCGSIVCAQTWVFVQDSVNAWYANELAAGKTPAEIDEYLSQFDVWDRYDHDGDGDFDEPDGYIDHFQSVHAGEGQETGGGDYGDDAIWSHRWYVQLTGIGDGGPTLGDGTEVPFGGTQIGESKYWIGDYTIEPENGGVGVFAHEFGHDLDLPDLYDTSGNTCPDDQPGCAENSTAFWTLMSSGSYGSDGTVDIGTKPTHMGAWEKLQLGWLDYELAVTGEKSSHKLGPASATTKQAQALITILPEKQVLEELHDPAEGEQFYYSGQGNDLDNVMYTEVDLTGGGLLSAQVNYDIEVDWDYAYVVVSDDGGATWTSIETNVSTTTDPNGQNFGFGITGDSGGWIDLTADLPDLGEGALVGFRYWTDVAAIEPGFSADEISINGGPPAGAEVDDGWTLDGFTVTTGSELASYNHYYIAAFRNYRGYDDSLRTGPYNFVNSSDPVKGNWVEHFSYQDGLLIDYWDTSQNDNNTSSHPGQGLILPVDAHPEAMFNATGAPWRARVQSYDSTFGLEATDALTLHWFGEPSDHPSRPAVPVFDDTKSYWDEDAPQASVIVPNTGTTIRVKSVSAQGNFMQVEVGTSSGDAPGNSAGKGKK